MLPAVSLLLGFLIANTALLAAVLIAIGLRGTLDLDDPACATCGRDLSDLSQRPHSCPACGAAVTGAGRVRFVRRSTRRGLVLLGALAGVCVALEVTTAIAWKAHQRALLAAQMQTLGPGRLSAASMSALATSLTVGSPSISIWMEIERRVRQGRVDAAEAETLVTAIIALARQARTDGVFFRLSPSPLYEEVIAGLARQGLLSDALIATLGEATVPPPILPLPSSRARGRTLQVDVAPMSFHGPFVRVDRICRVSLDGGADPWAGAPRIFERIEADRLDDADIHTIEVDVAWIIVLREFAAEASTFQSTPYCPETFDAHVGGRAVSAGGQQTFRTDLRTTPSEHP